MNSHWPAVSFNFVLPSLFDHASFANLVDLLLDILFYEKL